MALGRFIPCRSRTLVAACLLAALWLVAPASAECQKDSHCPIHTFRSVSILPVNGNSSQCTDGLQRPDIHAPILNMEIMQPELTTPGYIFMSPYHNKDPGPYIYDNYGVCFNHSVACIDSDLVVESCLVVFCAERTQDRPQSTRLQIQGRGPYMLLPGSATSRFRARSRHDHGQTLPRSRAGRDFRRHVLQ